MGTRRKCLRSAPFERVQGPQTRKVGDCMFVMWTIVMSLLDVIWYFRRDCMLCVDILESDMQNLNIQHLFSDFVSDI